MPEGTLNIDYHTRRLVLKALNRSRSTVAAARLLGISRRALDKLLVRYKISRQWVANESELQSMRPLQSVA